MIKVSHIVPVAGLPIIDGRDFYMCLANIAYKDSHYAEYYAEQVKKGAFVLLDNGAAEADQLTLDQILEVINKVNPNEVVLSDTLFNGIETIIKSDEAISFYRKNGYKGQFMFVPQGKNLEEWCKCYDIMMFDHEDDINTIGVSKFVTSGWNDEEARIQCVNHVWHNGKKDIHLLGCHVNINEIDKINSLYSTIIRSTDTAIAYIYSEAEKSILDGNRPKNEIDFIGGFINGYWLKKNIFDFDRMVMR